MVYTHGSPAHLVKKEQCRDPDSSFLLPDVLCLAVPRWESFLWMHLFWHQFWDKVVLSSAPPSQTLGENKETEQRTNVFEVTSPRAQLLTLQQWVMLWFSDVLLGAKWNNTGSAVGLATKHCTGSAMRAQLVPALHMVSCKEGVWSCLPPLHHQRRKIWLLAWPFGQLLYKHSVVIPNVCVCIQGKPGPKSRPKLKQAILLFFPL